MNRKYKGKKWFGFYTVQYITWELCVGEEKSSTGNVCGGGIIQYNTSDENYGRRGEVSKYRRCMWRWYYTVQYITWELCVGEEKCLSTGDVCGGGIIQYNTSHENYV